MLVYIAYRFNDVDAGKVLANIGIGHLVAYEFIKRGDYPYIPHADYQMAIMFGKHLSLDYYYASTMAFLEKCDAIAIVVDGQPLSKGVVAEMKRAIELKKMIYRAYVNTATGHVIIEEWKDPCVPAS